MQRLGLDYESLAAVNSSLIYASISGYGQDGPCQSRAGHDLGYLAVAGLLGLTGPQDGPPIVPGIPIADLFASIWTALGVVTALMERAHTGRGRHLDMSLLDSVSALLALPLAEWWTAGRPPQRGNMLLSGSQACYNIYQTADGRYMTLAALEPHFWQAFCEAVQRPDWQPRQDNEDQASLVEEVAALFQSQSQSHWEILFAEYDCCCEPVLDLDESFDHPQVAHRGLLRGRWLATPFAPSDASFTPAPDLGEHTAQVLAQLGYTAEETQRLRQNGVV
jgi:crotonobetainyl-CoA:carnitine CoA-transferase CaiB-like acyl-CoA transferase